MEQSLARWNTNTIRGLHPLVARIEAVTTVTQAHAVEGEARHGSGYPTAARRGSAEETFAYLTDFRLKSGARGTLQME